MEIPLAAETVLREPVYESWVGEAGSGRSFSFTLRGEINDDEPQNGTFDVAFCRVRDFRIDVLYFDGNSEEGIGRAGARFDREFVRLLFRAKEGREPTETESLELGEQFEEIKVLHHEEAVDFFEQLRRGGAIGDPLIADTPLEFYQLRGHGNASGGLFWPL